MEGQSMNAKADTGDFNTAAHDRSVSTPSAPTDRRSRYPEEFSRRQFLYFCAVSPFMLHLSALAGQSEARTAPTPYPVTIAVLRESYRAEMVAHKHYMGYASKASKERYPNIAYLFHSFSYSEKVHADNYRRVLATLGQETTPFQVKVDVRGTQSNLQKAAENELKKIHVSYPGFIQRLEIESCEEAIINCMYSWKSHKQHEETIKEIEKYSEMFFSSVSGRIEGMDLDFHVCKVCGATLDSAPRFPCVICNKSKANYLKIERPV